MPASPITAPAGYIPAYAVGYSDAQGNVAMVSTALPLPVTATRVAAPSQLTGTATASQLVGPFTPALGLPVILSLSGTWTGSITVQRSVSGGTTREPLTMAGSAWARYTGNVCEPVWEETQTGATLYLDIVLASGSAVYRIAQ